MAGMSLYLKKCIQQQSFPSLSQWERQKCDSVGYMLDSVNAVCYPPVQLIFMPFG